MHIYAYIQTYSASFMPYCKYNTCCCCFCYFFNYLCKHSSTIVFALTPAQSDYHNHAHQQFISASAAANNAAAAAAATCHCQLPGFGTNLHTKSTQDAKFKIVLAITLCCVFMVSKSITKQANHEARTHIHMRAQQQHCTSTVCMCVRLCFMQKVFSASSECCITVARASPAASATLIFTFVLAARMAYE